MAALVFDLSTPPHNVPSTSAPEVSPFLAQQVQAIAQRQPSTRTISAISTIVVIPVYHQPVADAIRHVQLLQEARLGLVTMSTPDLTAQDAIEERRHAAAEEREAALARVRARRNDFKCARIAVTHSRIQEAKTELRELDAALPYEVCIRIMKGIDYSVRMVLTTGQRLALKAANFDWFNHLIVDLDTSSGYYVPAPVRQIAAQVCRDLPAVTRELLAYCRQAAVESRQAYPYTRRHPTPTVDYAQQLIAASPGGAPDGIDYVGYARHFIELAYHEYGPLFPNDVQDPRISVQDQITRLERQLAELDYDNPRIKVESD
ncbi:hypothetical protein B0H16DRAFT_1683494 [Mycena metata]|uniref:Uncharacterized protein n=1 Tax=Mycena metata TaxID=1033252 RepID=A0AAD7K4P2_9AGAR|nr:hypothetical protein B0H16DRAFT_1683494 [Mycena metata]